MPSHEPPGRSRSSFDAVAADYDAARPTYPAELIGDVVMLAELPSPARILEIGCSTGQATLPFAQRGDRLDCLDIGASLLAIARSKFAAFPNLTFHHAAFEDWRGEPGAYDLVMSATAFHWIDPEVGYPKAAALLKDTGSLAIFSNVHRAFEPEFAADLYEIDRRIVPEWPDPREGADADAEVAEAVAAIDATGLFAPAIAKTYLWSQVYTSAAYLRLVNTYSNYQGLDLDTRARLYEALADLIDRRHAGSILKEYISVLIVARK